MIYYTFHQMLAIHFMIGLGFNALHAIWCHREGWKRWLFAFGEGLMGEKNRWLTWYLAAYVFEVITSIGHGFYWEISMSPIEALLLVLGAFAADRLALLFEMEMPNKPTRIFNMKAARERTTDRIQTAKRAARSAFENIVRGH